MMFQYFKHTKGPAQMTSANRLPMIVFDLKNTLYLLYGIILLVIFLNRVRELFFLTKKKKSIIQYGTNL